MGGAVLTILKANALNLPYPSGMFQCVVTSPPYFGKVRYGDDIDEHGTGSLSDYLNDIVNVGQEMWRVTDAQAVFWLNIGDTMANSGGAGGDHGKDGRKSAKPKYKQGETGLVGSQHCLVPEHIAVTMQEVGWQVKRRIIWDKTPFLRPEDIKHVRRPLDAYEHVFMFVKSTKRVGGVDPYRYRPTAHKIHGIELGDVWHFPPVRVKTGSQAPFPDELPRRCIALSTYHADKVLDPYAGSGTTIRVAGLLGRVGYGTDLYAEGTE